MDKERVLDLLAKMIEREQSCVDDALERRDVDDHRRSYIRKIAFSEVKDMIEKG